MAVICIPTNQEAESEAHSKSEASMVYTSQGYMVRPYLKKNK